MGVYIDPDAPARNGDGSRPGIAGPWLHWLLSECEGGKALAAREHVSHMGPSPPQGTHRYILVLFKQERGVILPTGVERKQWDFPAFVKANQDSLKPIAVNFFYCSAD